MMIRGGNHLIMRVDPKLGRWVPGTAAATLVGAVIAAAPATAAPPDITSGPTVSGTPQVGELLRADAQWEGAPSWRWLRCDSLDDFDCVQIPDATTMSYTVTSADLDKHLRVMLTVRHKVETEWRMSSRTEVVTTRPAPTPSPEPTSEPQPEPTAGPPPAPPPVPFELAPTVPTGAVLPVTTTSPRMMRPHPVVRIRGRLSRIGARITLLTVLAPRGARIAIRCRGRDCPARRWARTTALTRIARFERNLRAGTRLVITVTKPGRIGKHTTILIRSGHAPWRRDRCLEPGAGRPTK